MCFPSQIQVKPPFSLNTLSNSLKRYSANSDAILEVLGEAVGDY